MLKVKCYYLNIVKIFFKDESNIVGDEKHGRGWCECAGAWLEEGGGHQEGGAQGYGRWEIQVQYYQFFVLGIFNLYSKDKR